MDEHQATTQRLLGVVVPVYNEKATIAAVLGRLEALPCVREIVVVDDCSTDGTGAVIESLIRPGSLIRLIRQPVNGGKTAAVRRGVSEITSPLTIIQDADLEYDPQEIPMVIDPIVRGRADVVYGSRFLVHRAARVLYFYHYLANRSLTFLSNLFTNMNMTDIETCYKAFRTPLLQRLPLTSRGFGMEVEITAMVAKTRARVYEVPISYYGRTYDEGKKIGIADGVHALWYILYYNLVRGRSRPYAAYVRSINEWLETEGRAPAS